MEVTLFDMDRTLFYKMSTSAGHSWIITIPLECAANTDIPDELIDACAQKAAEGYVVSQVVQLMSDGRTPRVPVLSSKKFKKAYGNYLAMRQNGESNPFLNTRPASGFSAIELAGIYADFFEELAEIVLSPNSQWTRSIFTDTVEHYNRWAMAFRGKPTVVRDLKAAKRTTATFDHSRAECLFELKKLLDYALGGINDRRMMKELLADCGVSIHLYNDLCKTQTPHFCQDSVDSFFKDAFPVGGRILLLHMEDPYDPVPAGMTGTIDTVDDICQIHVKWDNGRTLAVVPEIDSFLLL